MADKTSEKVAALKIRVQALRAQVEQGGDKAKVLLGAVAEDAVVAAILAGGLFAEAASMLPLVVQKLQAVSDEENGSQDAGKQGEQTEGDGEGTDGGASQSTFGLVSALATSLYRRAAEGVNASRRALVRCCVEAAEITLPVIESLVAQARKKLDEAEQAAAEAAKPSAEEQPVEATQADEPKTATEAPQEVQSGDATAGPQTATPEQAPENEKKSDQ